MDTYAEALDICRRLTDAGHPTMLAGGCVRDRLLGHTPKDFDLATAAVPAEVRRYFKGTGIKIIPVGEAHGTLCLVTPHQHLEITTLRADLVCDGRHAQVAFSQSFQQDAQRRDFTINALYENHLGEIVDHVDGRADLAAKRLRFVGDAHARIGEDYLRILRYFRFLGRLGWSARPAELAAVTACRDGLLRLSAERVHREMGLTLATPHAADALRGLAQTGVLATLFPWYRADTTESLAALLPLPADTDPALVWHALFHVGGAPWTQAGLSEALAALRFSRKDAHLIAALERLLASDGPADAAFSLLRLLRRGGPPPADLAAYLAQVHERLGRPQPATAIAMLHGQAARGEPDIPRDALMRLPAQARGAAVDLAKIFWYLGLARDTNELKNVVANPESHRIRLEGHAP